MLAPLAPMGIGIADEILRHLSPVEDAGSRSCEHQRLPPGGVAGGLRVGEAAWSSTVRPLHVHGIKFTATRAAEFASSSSGGAGVDGAPALPCRRTRSSPLVAMQKPAVQANYERRLDGLKRRDRRAVHQVLQRYSTRRLHSQAARHRGARRSGGSSTWRAGVRAVVPGGRGDEEPRRGRQTPTAPTRCAPSCSPARRSRRAPAATRRPRARRRRAAVVAERQAAAPARRRGRSCSPAAGGRGDHRAAHSGAGERRLSESSVARRRRREASTAAGSVELVGAAAVDHEGTVTQQEIITAFGCRGFLSLDRDDPPRLRRRLDVAVGAGDRRMTFARLEASSSSKISSRRSSAPSSPAPPKRAALHLALASESLLPAAAAAAHAPYRAPHYELAFGHGGDRSPRLLTMLAALAPSFPTLSIHPRLFGRRLISYHRRDHPRHAHLSLGGAGGCLREERDDGGAPPADDCAWSRSPHTSRGGRAATAAATRRRAGATPTLQAARGEYPFGSLWRPRSAVGGGAAAR